MDIPSWAGMDQKQRIMAVGGGVALLLAIVLIARALFGGEAPEPIDPSTIQGIQGAVGDGTIKTPPPVDAPEDLQTERKGAAPVGG